MKQNPFSLYDFLGYVIPGALTLITIAFFHNLEESASIADAYNITVKSLGDTQPRGLMNLLEETVIFIILAYVVGHIVAYLSSLTVEKFSNWVYGYPSRFLLDTVPAGNYWKVDQDSDENNRHTNKERCLDLIWRTLIGIFLLPITICTVLFSKFLNIKSFFVKPLDKNLRDAINQKKEKLGQELGVDMSTGDYHRVIYHYEYENKERHYQKMDNYVALYGFLRAMCFIANCVTLWISYKYILPTIHFGSPFDWKLFFVLIACTFLTYIFFMAFMKFYRRFTLESFMCLIIDTSI